jgi:hypothetical protein
MTDHAGIYRNMKFAPYRYQEYPKWVTLASGEAVLVDSRKAELDAELDHGLAKSVPTTSQRELDLAKQLSDAQALIQELRLARGRNEEVAVPAPIVGKVETKQAPKAPGA